MSDTEKCKSCDGTGRFIDQSEGFSPFSGGSCSRCKGTGKQPERKVSPASEEEVARKHADCIHPNDVCCRAAIHEVADPLRLKLELCRKVLNEQQWETWEAVCPICDEHPHSESCWLAKLIEEIGKK